MKVKTSLRASLVLALVVCAGCTALGANPPDSPLGYASGGSASSLRAMRSAAGAKIKHVIVIIQENRSFDEMFQGFPGADTQNYGLNHLGKHVPLLQAPLNQRFGLPHGHSTFQLEADYDQSAGHYRMDGFDLVDGCSGKPSCKHSAYTYVQELDVANYWTYAQQYALGDMTFQPNMGPSWAAHQYLIAGQTGGYTSTLDALDVDPAGHTECNNPANYPSIDMTTAYPGLPGKPQSSCVTYPTIFDELNTAGIPWKYYARLRAGFWTAPSSVLSLWNNYQQNVSFPSTNVLTDIANHAIPPVVYVTPGDSFSDHPYLNLTNHGQDWLALIANAIGEDPYYWKNTVIVLTWDDWGGYFDHVPPPFAINPAGGNPDPNEYGMRVGFIVIGAYVVPHVVDHAARSSLAVLPFIESVFGLPSLGTLDAQQDDLMGLFNFSQTPNKYHHVTTHGWSGLQAHRDEVRDPSPIDDDMK